MSFTTTLNRHSQIVEGNSIQYRETILRRRLITELNTVEQMYNSVQTKDLLSSEILFWRDNFRDALNTHSNISSIYEKFTVLLQNILVDSLSQIPLDEQALLGSDGFCYSYKAICLLEYSLPEKYRSRAPSDLENPNQSPFTTAPHPLVAHMVKWLKSHEKLLIIPQELETDYQQLVNEIGEKEVLRLVPNQRNHRLRRIHQKAKFREQQKKITCEIEKQLDLQQKIITVEIKQEFEELTNRVDEFAKKTLEHLDVIDQKQKGNFIEACNKTSDLEEKADLLHHDITLLDSEIENVSSEIALSVKSQEELKSSIVDLEKAIEKRKKKQKMAVLKVVAIIGACALGTYLLQKALAEGFFAVVLPQSGGAVLSGGILL